MEFSNQEVESGGQELIQTLVLLTGLPEPWVRKELDQILEISGQSSVSVTLEQLREAMAAYLETFQADLLAESPPVLE